jgi:hypothetical protein
MPKVIQVIEALEPRGEGTFEDPCRIVTCYYTLDGRGLAERDPVHEKWLLSRALGVCCENGNFSDGHDCRKNPQGPSGKDEG